MSTRTSPGPVVVQPPTVQSKAPIASWYLRIKTVVDAGLALILLVLAFPLMAIAALAVKLTSRGPVLYSQVRLGHNGQPYSIYKIRTMVHNCECQSGACWSQKGDTRVTVIGRFLRASHLDELPQLWNVLCGEMSLVGPRPERPEFAAELEKTVPRYRDRLMVRPGITGLAQVQLPPDSDYASVRRKVAHDLHYVENLSWWLDLRLLACTALVVVGLPYGFGRTLLLLPGGPPVELAYDQSVSG